MDTLQEERLKPGAPSDSSKLAMILVMGITGSGKSYFVNKLADQQIVHEGRDLTSCTQKCQMVPVSIGGSKTLFIDTPGFDDTERTDSEVLAEIASILELQRESGILLKGIIYLHRITDIRYGRSAVKTFEIFRRMCGKDALKNVLLVTSRWADVDQRTGAERERQLRDKFWSYMLRSGSHLSRFHGDRESAIGLVSQLLAKESIVLEIQREICNGQTLDQTTAGSYVGEDIEKLKAQHQEDIQSLDELRSKLRTSEVSMREQVDKDLKEEKAKLQRQEQREANLHQDIRSRIRSTIRVVKKHSIVIFPLVALSIDVLGAFVGIPPVVYSIVNAWAKAASAAMKAEAAAAESSPADSSGGT